MEDKTLESLVPPLELCQQIPQGAFADSVLVWFGHRHTDKTMAVVPRNELGVACQFFLQRGVRVAYPAPTVDEILAALADFGKKATAGCITDSQGRHVFSAGYYADTYYRIDRTPAAAALRVWFDVKGRRDA